MKFQSTASSTLRRGDRTRALSVTRRQAPTAPARRRSAAPLLYLISIDPGGDEVAALRMLPLRVRRMRLERLYLETDAQWLRATMEHISRRFKIDVAAVSDELLTVHPKRGVAQTYPNRPRTEESRTNSTCRRSGDA